MNRSTVFWVVLALAGLALTAGITAAASSLSNQHVGLASEPLSAGDRLAPADVRSGPAPGTSPRTRSDRRHPPTKTSPTGSGRVRVPRSAMPDADDVTGHDESGKRGFQSRDGDDD